MLRELKYTWEQVVEVLLVSRVTLWRRLTEMGITTSAYTHISNAELDSIMERLVHNYPNNGTVMMWGQLRSINIIVPRMRVQDCLTRVCRRGVELRERRTITRRAYGVPSPNSLWHIDGLHCLVRWRIVIHGGIDGYSRRVVYLHASPNNRAVTVEALFRGAVHECGWPVRVRSDRGGENVDVARAMLTVRGTGRHSHIVGSSVHNQCIERLWRVPCLLCTVL